MEPLEIYDSINNKHLNVYVTTEVAEKCRTDNAFAQDLFHKLQDQNIEDGSAIEIETIKCEVNDEALFEETFDKADDKETWGRRETLKLIKTYQKHKDKFKNHPQKKTVWSLIASDLFQSGVYKTADKCAEKWKNLVRTYKGVEEKPSTPTRFQYFEELQNVFKNNEVIFSDSDPDDEPEEKFNPDLIPLESTSSDSYSEKESWSKEETLKLLKYFQKHKGLSHNFPTEKQLWKLISAELANDNIHKLPEKCASKWRSLYRSYKRNIEKSSLPLRFQYFQEVSDVVNDIELHIPDDIVSASDDMDFESILEPEQFKSFVEKTDFQMKPKDVVSWTQEETLQLIKAYKKHKNKFKMCPSKKYVWAIIVSELARQGIQRDVEKCENKWKSLLRGYRKGMESGEFPRFYFYEEMAECLRDDNVNDGEVSTTQNDVSMSHETTESENKHDPDLVDNAEASEAEADEADNNAAYEEIIIQTESDQPNEHDGYGTWAYDELASLIKVYALHKKNFMDPQKKVNAWKAVSLDLASRNIKKTPEMCEKKWRELYNTYRIHKMKKSGSGKFSFYTEIDDILKEKSEDTIDPEESMIHKEKCKCTKKKMLEKQQRHIERMQLLKRKLDLEERKVLAFEHYVKHLRTSNGR